MLNFLLTLLSYPRSALLTAYGIVHTLVMSIVVVFCALILQSRKAVDWCVRAWAMPLIKFGGVKVEVRGAENINHSGKGFLILFNHNSLYDIPILFAYIPRPFRFGAKIELFKIPLFGKAMEVAGVLPIDRGNRNKVMKVYEAAIARVHQGECFALAPEGTRQAGESTELGRFKRGPFEFAMNAQMDIVPVVLAGVLKVLPKHSIFPNMGKWKQKVIVQIFPAVPASEYTMENIDDLVERVRNQMNPAFQALNRELN